MSCGSPADAGAAATPQPLGDPHAAAQSTQPPSDPDACVAAALQHLGEGARVERDVSKGCDHVVKVVLLADESRVVLKIPRSEPIKVRKTAQCAAVCASAGIAAPRTIHVSADGLWLLEEFIPGEDLWAAGLATSGGVAPPETPEVCAWYREMGAALRRLHSVLASGHGERFEVSESGAVTGADSAPQVEAVDMPAFEAGVAAGWLTPEQLAKLQAQWARPHPTPARVALLHGDVSDDNVIVAAGGGAGRVTLIDFGDAWVGDPMADLARLYLFRHGTPVWDALVEGYGPADVDLERVQWHFADLMRWQLNEGNALRGLMLERVSGLPG